MIQWFLLFQAIIYQKTQYSQQENLKRKSMIHSIIFIQNLFMGNTQERKYIFTGQEYKMANIVFGGDGGSQSDVNQPGYRLIGVKGSYNQYLNSIKFLFMHKTNFTFKESPMLGNQHGSKFNWVVDLNKDERIKSLCVSSGRYVDSIIFNVSEKFGGFGGRPIIIALNGMDIYGMTVRHGYYIDSIRFKLS